MNIWKKPAPSINTHSSGYSNGPQGPTLFLFHRALRAATHCTRVRHREPLPTPATAGCNTGAALTTSGSAHFLTFAVLVSAHIHIPCGQGSRPAPFTPNSIFLHTDQQGEIPTSHATFPRWLPSFSTEAGRKLQVVILLKHLICSTWSTESWNALIPLHKPGT